MPAVLYCGKQGFWVSKGTKDLLYEVLLEIAKRDNLIAYEQLKTGAKFGFYGVSGMGFELKDFAEIVMPMPIVFRWAWSPIPWLP